MENKERACIKYNFVSEVVGWEVIRTSLRCMSETRKHRTSYVSYNVNMCFAVFSEPVTAAGRPSNWADSREGSFAGRRSRRSSITDDSQLTVENFGGSQDRLHFAGRNPEKELATLANVRKISAPAG